MPTHTRHVPMAQQSHAGALPASPDISDVEQERQEPRSLAVLVEPNGPVSTRALPTRAGAPATVVVSTSGAQVLGKDPKRCRVTLCSSDQPFYYSSREQSAWSTATAALWPANLPLVLLHADAICCASATANEVATIAIIPENLDGS